MTNPRFLGDFGRTRPGDAQIRPGFGQLSSISTNFGIFRLTVPGSTRRVPAPTTSGRARATYGRTRAGLGRAQPDLATWFPELDNIRPIGTFKAGLPQNRPTFVTLWPDLIQARPHLSRSGRVIRSNSARLDQRFARFGPTSADIVDIWLSPGRIWANSGRIRPKLSQDLAEIEPYLPRTSVRHGQGPLKAKGCPMPVWRPSS